MNQNPVVEVAATEHSAAKPQSDTLRSAGRGMNGSGLSKRTSALDSPAVHSPALCRPAGVAAVARSNPARLWQIFPAREVFRGARTASSSGRLKRADSAVRAPLVAAWPHSALLWFSPAPFRMNRSRAMSDDRYFCPVLPLYLPIEQCGKPTTQQKLKHNANERD